MSFKKPLLLLLIRKQATPEFTPARINTKIGDAGACATSDLFTPHPTLAGYWKIYGRADDQLMHNSGEKGCEVPFTMV